MLCSVYNAVVWMFQIEFVFSETKQNVHHLKHVYLSAKAEIKTYQRSGEVSGRVIFSNATTSFHYP